MTAGASTVNWVVMGKDLRLGYGRQVLFNDISFEVARREIPAVVGPNGSGKSTLLKAMLGLLPPLDGQVER